MHELAITQGILNQVLTEARKHSATEVKLIKVKVGEGMSIVPECVRFYFDALKKDTLAEAARMEIETVPLRLVCPKCQAEVKDFSPACQCGAGAEIVSGQELTVEFIEIETGRPRTAGAKKKVKSKERPAKKAGPVS